MHFDIRETDPESVRTDAFLHQEDRSWTDHWANPRPPKVLQLESNGDYGSISLSSASLANALMLRIWPTGVSVVIS